MPRPLKLAHRSLTNFQKSCRVILHQGLSPRSLALAIALGATIGIFPTIWGTSLLCFALAGLFRLNHMAVQLANYMVYPIQLGLTVPYFWLGKLTLPESFNQLSNSRWELLQGNWLDSIDLVLPVMACATTGWFITAPLFGLLVYWCFRILLETPFILSKTQTLTKF
ncbi:MAG: DUF2062 domain-containing protein [Deltaproteobacteria bacterium]|nr:DUF2062 domain-containing protein [Deltaproteobacteria bacterium]